MRPIKEIMTKDVITISQDALLKETGKILKEKRISGLPVVDENNKIVGIITLTDILHFLLDNVYQQRIIEKIVPEIDMSGIYTKMKSSIKVKDIMSRNVVALKEDDDLDKVLQLMFEKGIHTIPIMRAGKLVGIIGKKDISYAYF